MVEIDHGKGIATRYGHMSAILVSAGQHVTRGQQIGRMGSTGRSTGSHLHYEVRIDGRPVNPMPFMKIDRLSAARMKRRLRSRDSTRSPWAGPSAKARRSLPGWSRASYLFPVTDAAIKLTPSAARRVAAIAARQAKPADPASGGRRRRLRRFPLQVRLGRAPKRAIRSTETDGVRLVVDEVSLDLVRGSAVDFVEDMGGAAFKVDQPQRRLGLRLRLELLGLTPRLT